MPNLPPRLTFDTEELLEWLGAIALPPWRNHKGKLVGTKVDCAPIAQAVGDWLLAHGTIPAECELIEPDPNPELEPNLADARYFDGDDLPEGRVYPMSTCPRDPTTGDRLMYDVWIATWAGTWEYRRAGVCTRPEYDDERQGWTWGWVPEKNLPVMSNLLESAPTARDRWPTIAQQVEDYKADLAAVIGPPPPAQDTGPEQRTLADELLYEAWGVIANADGWHGLGDRSDWRGAAERWRDRWHAHLDGAHERREAEKANEAMAVAVGHAIQGLLDAIDALKGADAWEGPFHHDVYAAADKLRGGTRDGTA